MKQPYRAYIQYIYIIGVTPSLSSGDPPANFPPTFTLNKIEAMKKITNPALDSSLFKPLI